MIKINDCYYFPERKRLCLVVGINDDNVLASTIKKVDQAANGYVNAGACTYFRKALINAEKQKENIFFKITKLLELNYNVCNAILKQAKVEKVNQYSSCITTF